MKQTLKVAMIALVIMFCSRTANAQNTLTLINNTGAFIKASFVYYDNGCSCWVSRGWRKIPANTTNTINLDELNMGNRTMYVHAENFSQQWGRSSFFCMNDNGKPLQFADQQNCVTQKKFTQVVTGDGQNTFTFE